MTKSKKLVIFLSTLFAAMILLLTLGSGCAAEQKTTYTFSNEAEHGYFYVKQENGVNKVQLWNISVEAYTSDTREKAYIAFLNCEGTFTYAPFPDTDIYNLAISVPGYYFSATFTESTQSGVPEVTIIRLGQEISYKLGDLTFDRFRDDDGNW